MADKNDPLMRFTEILSQRTGVPAEEITKPPKECSEEQRQKFLEEVQKVKNLSKEERLKRMHERTKQDEDYLE